MSKEVPEVMKTIGKKYGNVKKNVRQICKEMKKIMAIDIMREP